MSVQDTRPSPRGVTIVVCCFNSERRLAPTLRHIARQYIDSATPWELVIVDNNSTDGTSEFARQLWEEEGAPTDLRIFEEPQAGQAYARRRGVGEARFEYLLFCDDDNWLDENYVRRVAEIFDTKPDVGVCGGETEAVSDTELPEWFGSVSRYMYAVGAQAKETGPVSKYLFGAGMGIRKSILKSFFDAGYSPMLVGRQGNVLLSGDDSEYNEWASIRGYKRWYDTELRLKHFIPSERLRVSYARRLSRGFGVCSPLLGLYRNNIKTQWSLDLLRSIFKYLRHLKVNSQEPLTRKLARIRFASQIKTLALGRKRYQTLKYDVKRMIADQRQTISKHRRSENAASQVARTQT